MNEYLIYSHQVHAVAIRFKRLCFIKSAVKCTHRNDKRSCVFILELGFILVIIGQAFLVTHSEVFSNFL
jgi:hypothetical protein